MLFSEGPVFVHADSLSQTVDAVHQAEFERRKIPAPQALAAARWIAARQGLPGAYGGTFAAFDQETAKGISLFTGERVTSASARHILGEEACRALRFLKITDSVVQTALERGNEGLMRCVARAAKDPRNNNPGLYCCGKCTVGFWRNLLSGGLDRQEERLWRGVQHLRSARDGEGGWRRFPFWYTTLSLSQMEFRGAKEELEYARVKIEQTARRRGMHGAFAHRRYTLACRVLGL